MMGRMDVGCDEWMDVGGGWMNTYGWMWVGMAVWMDAVDVMHGCGMGWIDTCMWGEMELYRPQRDSNVIPKYGASLTMNICMLVCVLWC